MLTYIVARIFGMLLTNYIETFYIISLANRGMLTDEALLFTSLLVKLVGMMLISVAFFVEKRRKIALIGLINLVGNTLLTILLFFSMEIVESTITFVTIFFHVSLIYVFIQYGRSVEEGRIRLYSLALIDAVYGISIGFFPLVLYLDEHGINLPMFLTIVDLLVSGAMCCQHTGK